MKNKEYSLNGIWFLSYAAHRSVTESGYSPVCLNDVKAAGLPIIKAAVPGNVELDLMNAGIIDDPFFGDNILKARERESLHFWYSGKFKNPFLNGGRTELVLEGVDTFADIYLDGKLLGHTDNMLISHSFILPEPSEGEHELFIHIMPTVIAARKYESAPAEAAFKYNFEGLYVRKAPHMFGWDIFPRLVSAGLWRGIYLKRLNPDRIREAYVYTRDIAGDSDCAHMTLFYQNETAEENIHRYSVKIEGCCDGSSFCYEEKLWFNSGQMSFTVDKPSLWWPRGRGRSALYDAEITLLYDGEIRDSRKIRFGIRTAELDYRPITESDDGEFCFRINGERIFIRGTNWVAADALHSRDSYRIDKMLKLVCETNCNMIRCWGGSVYEDHDFFDKCDEYGIMVWQDFVMGCGLYPQNDDFAAVIKKEVRQVVRKLRGHPSLVIWCGDNECDVAAYEKWFGIKKNPSENRLTRIVIPSILRAEDFTRPYIPSSPYVEESAYNSGITDFVENHLWGPRDYYKSSFYTNTKARFVSEIGYHGCVSPESAALFLSPRFIRLPQNNSQWLAHATSPGDGSNEPYAFRINLMQNQTATLFGNLPENYPDFALASQLSQAEAIKFFIESFRMQKWEKTGLIWWNLIDGWPQFSDAIVDYYFNRKQAYFHIRQSQLPFCMMISEKRENGTRELIAVNDLPYSVSAKFSVIDCSNNAVVTNGTVIVPADGIAIAATIITESEAQGLYYIRWETGEKIEHNHYLYGAPPYPFKDCRRWFAKAGLICADGFT